MSRSPERRKHTTDRADSGRTGWRRFLRLESTVLALLATTVVVLVMFDFGGPRPTGTTAPTELAATPSRLRSPLHEAARRKFFAADDYTRYDTMEQVPWLEVLSPDRDWSDAEERNLERCLGYVATIVGQDDPVTKLVMDRGKPGCPLSGVVALDRKVAVGKGAAVEYFDAMWVPKTKLIYIRRDAVAGGWVTFVTSTLYQELVHVTQFTTDVSREDLHRFEVEAHRKQLDFNARLRDVFAKSDHASAPRWLAEMEVIDENLRDFARRYEAGEVPNQGPIRLK